MVRIKLGRPDEAAGGAGASLAFALEVDGVDVLGGAGDEPAGRLVPDLLDALGALYKGKSRCGQVSLPDSQLELCLFRTGENAIELSVVRLSRPMQQVGKPVALDFDALLTAARDCARQWPAPGVAGRLKGLEGPRAPFVEPARAPFAFSRPAGEAPGVALAVEDAVGRRFAWDRRARAHLPPLLFPGTFSIGASRFAGQPPFLALLEATRAALAPEPTQAAADAALHRALFTTGLDFAAALVAEHPPLAKNPYLEVLIERCHLGLGDAVRAGAAAAGESRQARVRKPRAAPDLGAGLALRRVRFEAAWEKPAEWGEGPARLLLSKHGVVVAGTHVALGFGPGGAARFRRMGTHGVAASASGTVITASAGRVLCFLDARPSALWLRDHDGSGLGPELLSAQGQLVCRFGMRGVVSFCATTGRELWRVDPPRARVTTFSVEGDRAILPTDSGLLVAVQLSDGVPFFRMRAAAPLPHRLVRAQTRHLGVLSQGTSAALFAVDLKAAAIAWTRELPLAHPSEPLPHKGRLYLAGERDGRASLVQLDGRGQVRWEKPLPLASGRYALAPAGPGVLVQDGQGSAALVLGDGEIEWRVGGSTATSSRPIAPHLARGVAVLPGDTTRVVDVKTGRVLTDLPMRGLVDLAVDKQLRVYALEDPGTLRVLELTTHLAVV